MRSGLPNPLGATLSDDGVNFAVIAPHSDAVELCIFDDNGHTELDRIVLPGKTGNVWHGFLVGAQKGLCYGYRAHGKYAPRQGHRFNKHKLLLDPYARQFQGHMRWRPEVFGYTRDGEQNWRQDLRDSASAVPKSVVTDPAFDWGGDHHPRTSWEKTIIYELHVKGFTQLHPAVPPQLRGTYLGLAEPAVVRYLQDLGVTAVELMPCQAFLTETRLTDLGLSNYWGYNPIGFFAPHDGYAVHDPVREFKTMVKALHEADIEVFLDVVFNHTAEAGEDGPTLSLRGLDTSGYYLLDPSDLRRHINFSGCGNTLDVSEPNTLRLITDCLRYWVEEMHLDGFRFDLATILARDERGFRGDGAFLSTVNQDPVLATTKLIAEPWDIGPDGYRLGGFPPSWSEWNDRYRDTIKSFWRGDAGKVSEFAERIAGSSDLFRRPGRQPTASINYVACHDGFTLNDAVSYSSKHNQANGEANNDGSSDVCWNCGTEGPTSDKTIEKLRTKQRRNMLATVLLSQGVPMLMAGDEFGRTQAGNNNAYCQDNELSWIDWSRVDRDRATVSFVTRLIRLRTQNPVFRRTAFLDGLVHPDSRLRDVTWLREDGQELSEEDWQDGERQMLGILLDQAGVKTMRQPDDEPMKTGGSFLMLFNAASLDKTILFPEPVSSGPWQLVLDTHDEIAPMESMEFGHGQSYLLRKRSMVLFSAQD
jgi:glycogen operon protein